MKGQGKEFKVGDEVAVFACGHCVAIRTIVRATARKAVDSDGDEWTMNGERWGYANRAVDADFIRLSGPDDRRFLDTYPRSMLRVNELRSKLRRVLWFSPGGADPVPSDQAVLEVWAVLSSDLAFLASQLRPPRESS